MKKTFESTLDISKEEWDEMILLEGIEDLDNTDEGCKDSEGISYVFEFDNGDTITVTQYSGSTNYWTELFLNDEYDFPEIVDLAKTITYKDNNTGNTYICKFNIT